jgi:transposase
VPDTPDVPDVVAALQTASTRLRAENAELKAENAELKAQLAEQAEKIARLERLVSRNSGNSSVPPSTDDQRGKIPPERRPRGRGGRKPGRQPGAPGAYLAWNDRPDKTVPHFPAGTCECGKDLAEASDLGVRYSHQVTDLPEARAETIQHDRHAAQCSCGRMHVADAPPEAAGAPGTVTYGLNFQAWCVFLMVMHHVPVERCADIIASMSGTRPSDGWVHALLARAAEAVAAANKVIRALIILARVVCGDETPLRAGPGPKTRKMYLQVACTSLLTCYFLGGRDLPSFRQFVYSGLHGAVVVHDRYVNYDAFDGISHQLCTQHLLRDLEDAAQTYPDAIWPGLIHAANLACDQGMAAVPGDMTAEHLTPFRRGVTVGLSKVRRVPGAKTRQPPARTLLECLRHREAGVLRFLTDTAISPTSNQANATCGRRKPSRRSPARSAPRKPPVTGMPSADTPPPPPSTASPSSPPSMTP